MATSFRSTYYLVDLHTTPIADSEINDVRFSEGGEVVLGGNFVVKIPIGVALASNPNSLTQLLTKKYAGLLAFYAGYTRITYDAMLDTSNIDMANSAFIAAADRCGTSLAGNGSGVLQSDVIVLTGAAPSECIVTYETFNVVGSYPRDERQGRLYSEREPAAVSTCEVSFNGGATWLSTSDGDLLNIPLPDQGTNFVFRLNAGAVQPERVFLGSWAVVY